jgi:hypothetical protein
MLISLGNINEGTKQMVDIFLKTQDPEKIGGMIADDLSKGMSFQDISSKYGEDFGKYIKAAGGSKDRELVLKASASLTRISNMNLSPHQASMIETQTKGMGEPTPEKEGYAIGGIFRKPANIMVAEKYRPEAVLPLPNNFKNLISERMAGPTTGTSSKNLTVNMNLSGLMTNEAARVIENKIRSMWNDLYLTGMA